METEKKKKTVQLALIQDVGPCIVILFKPGFGTFNMTQEKIDFYFAKRGKLHRGLDWQIVHSYRQEAIIYERIVDNKIVHVSVAEQMVAQNTATIVKLSDTSFILHNIENSLKWKIITWKLILS